jgi:hypothetical protein
MTLTIPSGIWAKYYEAADLFIDNNNIGKACTLIYPPIRIDCSNCVINHFGGISTNVYRHGGPAPFNGKCPLCGGSGRREEETTGSIRLRIYHSRRDWIKVNNLNIPDATVQVIGYATDLPNLLRANEVRLISEQNVLDQRYQLAGAPFLHGFGHNRYFIAHLKRV